MELLTSVHDAADRITGVLSHKPAGLLSDFDGTLSRIALTPSAATAAPGAVDALNALSSRLDIVGIVTGRALDDVQQMIGVPGVLYVGNHGLESLQDGQHRVHPAGLEAGQHVTSAFEHIEQQLSELVSTRGMLFEHKRLSGTVHYRIADEADRIGAILEPIATAVAEREHLRVTNGKMMVELLPLTVVTKGTAIRDIVRNNNLESVVFLGDDITDVDGFRTLHELRASERVNVCAVGVLTADTAPEVVEHSDILIDGVENVISVLNAVAQRLGGESAGVVGEDTDQEAGE